MKRTSPLPLLAALGLSMACGCGKAPPPPPESSEAHIHQSHAPHSGTVVALGDGQFHVELVLDPAAGRLQAYVLDDELENFVRSPSHSVDVSVRRGGTTKSVTLVAVANPATGETVGDTALFEGQAEWLRATSSFEGTIGSMAVRGSTFTKVPFSFPGGDKPAR
ncbi:MAG TPA: hypothetical protein VFE25_12895 [Opitutaceae bacterium]|jgi:hypothetical protein|nr:hypothetical protein [Opitutaceae bacterium]